MSAIDDVSDRIPNSVRWAFIAIVMVPLAVVLGWGLVQLARSTTGL
jgi:hypothetical protein